MATVLEGLKVLDLSWGTAGPLTSMLLSDYGAEVVKIEPPGGDPFRASPAYLVWNRGKQSAVLDLKDPTDLASFGELARRADILIESFSPGTMERLGIGYESLQRENPRLIYCSITGYGRHSQSSQRPAYDALVQARSGAQSEQPGWRAGPIFLHLPLPSFGASYLASCAIHAALHAREVTGVGQWVETSLMQGVLAFTTMLWIRVENPPASFYDIFRYRDFPPTPCHEAGDGKWFHPMPQGVPVALAAVGRDMRSMPGSQQGSYEERKAWFAAVEQLYRSRPRDFWLELLREADVPCEPSLPAEEAFADPQIVHNGVVTEVDIPGLGPVVQFAFPWRLERNEARVQGPPPGVGQHTEEVLSGLQTRPVAPKPEASRRSLRYALEGVRVLDFGVALAGPYGPMILGDLGAEVIKVERVDARDGSVGNQVWAACQRGKRCISLDLKAPEGQRIAHELIASADVLHYNMRVGVAERLGFGYETAKRINPRIIYCHTTGYGSTGPRATWPGVDQMGQALVGLEWEQGAGPAGSPGASWSRFGMCDTGNGFQSAIAVLQALYHRDRTGQGQFVETNILNCGTYYASDAFLAPEGVKTRPHLDAAQTGLGPLYRLYETRKGWICIVVFKEAEWQALCRALERADLARDPRFASREARERNAELLATTLEPMFETRTAKEWFERLDRAGVPCEVSSETYGREFFDDPDAIANEWVVEYRHHSMGSMEQFGRLFSLSETPGKVWGPPPVPGEHSREILRELGYGEAQIQELGQKGVTAWPE